MSNRFRATTAAARNSLGLPGFLFFILIKTIPQIIRIIAFMAVSRRG